MPLRSPEIVGMTDPRDLASPPRPGRKSTPAPRKTPNEVRAAREPEPDLRGALDSAMNGTATPAVARTKPAAEGTASGPPPTASRRRERTAEPAARDSANSTPVPDDQERAFVQILAPPELAVRIGRASHYLKLEVHKTRFQQTVMGAIIDRSIPDPDDPAVISAMATAIARWRQDPLSEKRASRRLGWRLPLEISARLDQLLLNLKEQHYRLRPSATSLISALIWLELDPDSASGQAALRELVLPYYDKYERPDYSLAGA
ncbi:MAG: hypothetical protein WBP81_37240 [Solirubrobacteraceae bacterium]